MVHNFDVRYINIRFSTFCNYKIKKTILFRGHLFLNSHNYALLSDTKYFVPIKLCKMAGSIHLLKNTGIITSKNVRLKRNKIWDIMEIEWKEDNVTLNGNKINLPKSVTIKFRENFKIRCLVKREPLLFHIMLKQGFTLFTLASRSRSSVQFPLWILHM